jgi:hypothetical protein
MTIPSTDSPARQWLSLPEELRAKLRLGFTGKGHLLDMAGWCLRSGDLELFPVAAHALETAIRENPLDGAMACELLALEQARGLLEPVVTQHLQLLADRWHPPVDLDEYRRLQAERDFKSLKTFTRAAAADQPGNLFWTEQGVVVGCMDGDEEFVAELIESGSFSGAEVVIERALKRVSNLFAPEKGVDAEALRDQAMRRPWDAGTILRAFDALNGVADRREPVPGSVAVCLYSWNKAGELAETLISLADSDLAGASLFVLDNGSTDGTAGVLREWASRFESLLGANRFTVISLPVNIGAAAARNWLLHREDVHAHEFVCYLDDDVELPADWLARLGAAVAEYPEAGVWGCKVVDHFNPLLIQGADSHLLADPAATMDLARAAPHPFRLSDLHIRTLDGGGFDFMRPCASVMGCCHLFRTRTLVESGGFAIQLSPSQYDDMEHDLRLCEVGTFPVYQGHLAVRHKKRTGAASRTSMQEQGNALGNKYKMQTMHDPAAINGAAEAGRRLLDEDILRKLAWLERA